MTEEEETRYCKGCDAHLPLKNFYKSCTRYSCKECYKKIQRERYCPKYKNSTLFTRFFPHAYLFTEEEKQRATELLEEATALKKLMRARRLEEIVEKRHRKKKKSYLQDLQIPLPPLHVQNSLKPLFDHISSLKSSIKIWDDKVDDLIRQLGQESQRGEQDDEQYTQIVIEDDANDSDIVILDDSDEDEPETLTVETLKKKNCKELRAIAKERSISGRSKMKKAQLIEAIMS